MALGGGSQSVEPSEPVHRVISVRGREETGALRAAGGVTLALGALLVATRREHSWTEFELMLVIGAPAVLMLALAVKGSDAATRERAESWRGVLLVTAVVMAPVALLLFLEWIGAGTSHVLLDAAVSAAAAALAWVGAGRTNTRYAMLLAGIALLITWMLVWSKVFHDPSGNTLRWLLAGGGAALMLTTALADLAGVTGAGELATAGAIGLVTAGVLGVLISAFQATLGQILLPLHQSGVLAHPHVSGTQTNAWDAYLLIVAVVLIVIAARSRLRGLGYVGVLGIFLFLVSTAAQLVRTGSGHGASHSLLGWPLILVLLGLAGLAAPLLRRRPD